MRRVIGLNNDWTFTNQNGVKIKTNIPHTWNNIDGQDGGNDYYRGVCVYSKKFEAPDFQHIDESVYLEFEGVNASADIVLNGCKIFHHDGGYSTFRMDITDFIDVENEISVFVDNTKNSKVYPQQADFTFYGGIYRDVQLLIVPKVHFDLDYYGSHGLKISPMIEGKNGKVQVETFLNDKNAKVKVIILDHKNEEVVTGSGTNEVLVIPEVQLWNGMDNPYLYTAVAQLIMDDKVIDEVRSRFGVRSFQVDPNKGFLLNGKPYPLHGVSRHQDRKGIGNALTKEQHLQDMETVLEIGANSVRLAHYQQDQYIYDFCDEKGLIVCTEIPYISSHMQGGRDNTISQMKELIAQNYNHACIMSWGLSNEITISTKNKKDMYDNHRVLNELCHRMDETRPTSLACYAMCFINDKVVHISDIVGYNLYLGWYVPGFYLNDLFMSLFHFLYPKRSLSYLEYGAEGMPNLHSNRPRRGDHTEEYQARYHEFMLKCFERHPYLWGTYCWNLFDFAADARDQGGEPGMNHKGLVTFDRAIKKDSFYLYKAYWSKEGVLHLCGKRYIDRTGRFTIVKVYSNQSKVTLYNNGKLIGEKTGSRVFTFKIALEEENNLEVVAGSLRDNSFIKKVDKPNKAYKLKKSKSKNWV